MMKLHSNHGRLFSFVVMVTLVALAGACGPFHRGSTVSTYIIFKNESLDQATVYAAGPDGNQVRIGTVMPGRTDTLTVPATVIGQGGNISVSARLLARTAVVRSGMFSLREGETINIRLPSDEKLLIVLPDGQ